MALPLPYKLQTLHLDHYPVNWSDKQLRDQALKLKEEGNAGMREKDYGGAVVTYTRGLTYCPNDIDLLSNRSLAYLRLDCNKLALDDVNKVLSLNPMHEKCLYRKVKVLCGLKKYEKALEFALGIPTEILTKPDASGVRNFESLEAECRKMIEQSKGNFDLHDIFHPSESKETFAEYIGPLKIAEISGKGLGLIATADIEPGQLLICTKPVAYVSDEDAKKFFIYHAVDTGILKDHDLAGDYCMTVLCQKLFLDPRLTKSFFELSEGNSNNFYTYTDNSVLNLGTAVRNPAGGIANMLTTYKMNMIENFASSLIQRCIARGRTDLMFGKTPKALGVWNLPSYLNHVCIDPAATCDTSQKKYMFVRSLRKICKGEEITAQYFQPYVTDRRELMKCRVMICNCKLCYMEDTEPREVREEVEKTLKLIQTELAFADSKTQILRIWELVQLRQNFPNANLALLDPSIQTVWEKIEDHSALVNLLEKIFEVAKGCYYDRRRFDIAERLVQCYLLLKDGQNANKWLTTLKSSLANVQPGDTASGYDVLVEALILLNSLFPSKSNTSIA